MELRRVAVTGVGVLSSCGTGRRRVLGRPDAAPPEGERRVHDFDPTSVFDNPKEARRADRVTQLALAAATQALEQAGDVQGDPLRRGVLIATGIGGIGTLEEQITALRREGRPPGVAVPRPDDDAERPERHGVDALGLAGPVPDREHRLRRGHPRARRRGDVGGDRVAATSWPPAAARRP